MLCQKKNENFKCSILLNKNVVKISRACPQLNDGVVPRNVRALHALRAPHGSHQNENRGHVRGNHRGRGRGRKSHEHLPFRAHHRGRRKQTPSPPTQPTSTPTVQSDND